MKFAVSFDVGLEGHRTCEVGQSMHQGCVEETLEGASGGVTSEIVEGKWNVVNRWGQFP